MAAFVGAVACQYFGMLLFSKHGPARFMSQKPQQLERFMRTAQTSQFSFIKWMPREFVWIHFLQ